MYIKIKNRQGITIVSLIIIIVLVAIGAAGVYKFMPGIKNQLLNIKEYGIEISVEKAARRIYEAVKYSENICALPRAFVKDIEKLDPSLNYFMVSHDGRRIIIMAHDGNKFVERTIVRKRRNVEYEMFFEKQSGTGRNNAIKYVINAYILDAKESTTGSAAHKRKITFESTTESMTASNITDKGTGISKNNTAGATPSAALACDKDK